MSGALSIDVDARRGRFGLRVELESAGGVVAVVGPSGAGKSTLLDAIAGLLRPDRGRIRIGRRTLFDAAAAIDEPSHRRGIGVVFQDGLLLPHRTVLANLRYGAGRAGVPLLSEAEAIEELDLAPHLMKHPRQLSGGERTRVAIARALLSRPSALLLDEPFAALDPSRRAATIGLVRRAIRAGDVPTLVVTHHIEEALELTEEILHLRDGRSVAHGSHRELAHHPEVLAHLGREGFVNALVGTIERDAVGPSLRLEGSVVRLRLAAAEEVDHEASLPTRRVFVPAHAVALAREPLGEISIRNRLAGRIVRISIHSGRALVEVRLDGSETSLVSEIGEGSLRALRLSVGVAVVALVKSQSIRLDRRSP